MRTQSTATLQPWSDADLDSALNHLRVAAESAALDTPTLTTRCNRRAIPRRGRVLTGWRRPALIAAAVAVLAGAALTVPLMHHSAGSVAAVVVYR